MTCATCGDTGWVVVPMPRCIWNGRLVNYVDKHGVDHGGIRTAAVTCDDCSIGKKERDDEAARAQQMRTKEPNYRGRPTFLQYCANINGMDGAALLRDFEIERAAKAREGVKPDESFEAMFPRLAARMRVAEDVPA